MALFPPKPQPQPEPVPVPVPVPVDEEPVTWRPGERKRVEDYWGFIRWQAARERRDWPDRVQAPLEISPDARYVDG